jgi:hypothetical protein
VRALQLEPAIFRCGIAIDAPLELRSWLRTEEPGAAGAAKPGRDIPAALIDHPGADWKKLSVVDQADTLENPVLFLVEPTRSPALAASTAELRARLQQLGRPIDYVELDPGFAAARPNSRASVYRKIEDFLNLHLDGYAVKIGPAKEVE